MNFNLLRFLTILLPSLALASKYENTLIEVASDIALKTLLRQSISSHFCLLVYKGLESHELKLVKNKLTQYNVSFLEANIPKDQVQYIKRFPGNCAVILARGDAGTDLVGASRLAPLANYILLPPDNDNDLSVPRPAIHLTKAGPFPDDPVYLKTVCNDDKVIARNVWNKERGYTLPFEIPFGPCENIGHIALRGRHFTVAAFGASPYVIFSRTSFGGIDADIMNVLAQHFKFTYQVKVTRGWGFKVNGSWTGLVGAVERGEAQFGIGQVAISYIRLIDIDYLWYSYLYSVSFLVSKPKPAEAVLKLLEPLDYFSWIAFLLAAIAGGIFAILSLKLNPQLQYDRKKNNTVIFIDSVIMYVQAHNLSGDSWMSAIMEKISGWIVVFQWMLLSTLFYFFYVSNLRSILMTVRYNKPLNTITDVMDNDGAIYYMGGSSAVDSLRFSPNKDARDSYMLAVKNKWFYRPGTMPDHIIKRVLDDNSAMQTLDGIIYKYSFEYFKKFGTQPFRQMEQKLAVTSSGFAIAKEFYHVKEPIDRVLNYIQDFGFLDKFTSKHVPPRVVTQLAKDEEAMDLWHFSSTFFFYGLFLILACTVFGVEMMKAKRKNPKEKD